MYLVSPSLRPGASSSVRARAAKVGGLLCSCLERNQCMQPPPLRYTSKIVVDAQGQLKFASVAIVGRSCSFASSNDEDDSKSRRLSVLRRRTARSPLLDMHASIRHTCWCEDEMRRARARDLQQEQPLSSGHRRLCRGVPLAQGTTRCGSQSRLLCLLQSDRVISESINTLSLDSINQQQAHAHTHTYSLYLQTHSCAAQSLAQCGARRPL